MSEWQVFGSDHPSEIVDGDPKNGPTKHLIVSQIFMGATAHYCENCGVMDGETQRQYYFRKGIDPGNSPLMDEPHIVTQRGDDWVCQQCAILPKNHRLYDSGTGESKQLQSPSVFPWRPVK
jgi:hypothetical protein